MADIAAKIGLPADWRVIGFDTPEYMESEDSLYLQPDGLLRCVWPGCNFRRQSVEAMFRHVHGASHSGSTADVGA